MLCNSMGLNGTYAVPSLSQYFYCSNANSLNS